MSWRDFLRRDELDSSALLALARQRFPNRSGEVAARVIMIFHVKFRIGSSHLLPSARLLEDLGFDGMDISKMIGAVEKEFACQFHDDDLERGMTLDGLIAKVEKASVQQSAGGNAAAPRASA